MKEFKSFQEACTDSGTIDLETVKKTFAEHNEIDKKMQQDEGKGGQYDAYGGGKTYDQYGKKFFKNGPLSVDDEWHVAIVTPVIHYCMGGAQIDAQGAVVLFFLKFFSSN